MASSMSGDGGSEAIDTSTRVGGSVGVAGGGFGNSVSHTGSAVSAGAGMSELSEYPQDNEYANRVQKRVKKRSKAPKTFVDESGSERPTRIGKKYAVNAETGEASYKKVTSNKLASSIQLGIRTMVSSVTSRKDRDLLHTDFSEVESRVFPKSGSSMTPPHHFDTFKFYSYAPYAFRSFRAEFGISTAEFMLSICDKPLIPLSNPGASGSVFFLSNDDQFIIKTVQKGEHNFMRGLLPGYYMNLVQNKRTLLPKFFGLFCYQNALKQNIRFIVMNNILPTRLEYFQRFDLKGSTKGRLASKKERRKKRPCYKDLDFNDMHTKGLMLESEMYERLKRTLERDGKVLESFAIMDYSLLIGVHRIGIDEVKESLHVSDSDFSDSEGGNTFHEGVFSGSVPENVRLQLTGAGSDEMEGAAVYINGKYEVLTEPHNGKRVYRNLRLIPQGHGVLSGSPLFLFFDATSVRWVIATEVSVKGTTVAFAAGDYNGPLDVVKGAWQVATLEGKFVSDTHIVVGEAVADEGTEDEGGEPEKVSRRRRSMSFGTITEQLDLTSVAKDHGDSEAQQVPATVAEVDEDYDPYEGGLRVTLEDERGKTVDAVIYLGIIDVLQHFGLRKKLEHKYKSIRFDGDACSVHKPDFYRQRFETYLCNNVFQLANSRQASAVLGVSQVDRETIQQRIKGRAIGNERFLADDNTSRNSSNESKKGVGKSLFGSLRSDKRGSKQSSRSTSASSLVAPGTSAAAPTSASDSAKHKTSATAKSNQVQPSVITSDPTTPTSASGSKNDTSTDDDGNDTDTPEADTMMSKSLQSGSQDQQEQHANTASPAPHSDWGEFTATDANNASMLFDPASGDSMQRLETPVLIEGLTLDDKVAAGTQQDQDAAMNGGPSPALDADAVKATKARIEAVRKEREGKRAGGTVKSVPPATGQPSPNVSHTPEVTEGIETPTKSPGTSAAELDEFMELEKRASEDELDISRNVHLLKPVAQDGAMESLI